MISRPHWRTPHPGFSTEAPGPNGMNVTTALPSHRFQRERFQASIPQPSPSSFPPSIETGSVTTPSDRRHQRRATRRWDSFRVADNPGVGRTTQYKGGYQSDGRPDNFRVARHPTALADWTCRVSGKHKATTQNLF